MSYFTQTLFGRTVLVILAAVLFTQLATTYVIQHFYVLPLLERALDDRANHILTLANSLDLLTEAQRTQFIHDFEDSEGARILTTPPPVHSGLSRPRAGERLQALEERLQHLISPTVQVLTTSAPDAHTLWIGIETHHGRFWYVTQRLRFDRGFPTKWGLQLALMVLITVVGVYWGVRRINTPLQLLTHTAQRIALGESPEIISASDGPQEIKALGLAFRSMQQALHGFESNRAIMLAGVSHDLRTPLSRLRLALEMIPHNDERNRELMIADLEEIDRVIDQFLDFARNEPHEWLVSGNLNEVVQVCQERFTNRNYPTQFSLNELPDSNFNERAMERVITNLVENALHYARPPIEICTSCSEGNIYLSVLDRGQGIPPEEASRLKQPFTRLEPARTGHPGSGLGLAIVDRIIQMHGGQFELLPRAGGGLEARVRLPLPQPPSLANS